MNRGFFMAVACFMAVQCVAFGGGSDKVAPDAKAFNPFADIDREIARLEESLSKESDSKKADKIKSLIAKQRADKGRRLEMKLKPLNAQLEKVKAEMESLSGKGKDTSKLEAKQEDIEERIDGLKRFHAGESPSEAPSKEELGDSTKRAKEALKNLF